MEKCAECREHIRRELDAAITTVCLSTRGEAADRYFIEVRDAGRSHRLKHIQERLARTLLNDD